MGRRSVIGAVATAALVLVGLALALTHVWTRYIDQKKIHEAELRAVEMKAGRESLFVAVRTRDSLEAVLQGKIGELVTASGRLREQVTALERARQSTQLAVRLLDGDDATQASFARAFPEIAPRFRQTEVRDPVEGLDVQYFMLPFRTVETFIIEHNNSASYQRQRDSLIALDTLNRRTLTLKDSLFSLEHSNRVAFQTAYDTTFSRYMRLNDDYISVLKQPRLRINVPKWPLLAITAIVGGVGGALIW